ncbi:uncharacterized protein LOC123209189 isoform X2 [Mangifera indica]|uniref:uncharacterized protein LOC123209189 isoform X2 n=1 Tax=Mangifera indica TaxID=29780 RepID=UPI001CFB7570|nr:uncharacterized protein LOC123209189 isoform X2 [Mangifera indica]
MLDDMNKCPLAKNNNKYGELMNIQVATLGNGATTVSATKFFASMVGIPVFVTGENKMYTGMESRETQGVCVAAYKTHEFSTFSIETSGCNVLMCSVLCYWKREGIYVEEYSRRTYLRLSKRGRMVLDEII